MKEQYSVLQQPGKYLEENSLHLNHQESRKGHSTTTEIQMYDCWVSAVDSEERAGDMVLDLSAAFNMVDLGILLEKLKLLWLERKAVM